MIPRDDGVDLVFARDGETHTLRLRYFLDGKRTVRLLGTGVLYSTLVRVEVLRHRIDITPSKYAPLVNKCIDRARPLLKEALGRYMRRFPPSTARLLDMSAVV